MVVIFTAANICRGGKGNIVRVLTETVQQGTRLEMVMFIYPLYILIGLISTPYGQEEELDTAAVKL